MTPASASRGGTEVKSNTFSIGYTFSLGGIDQVCSGALLSGTILVTAAHCVMDSKGNKSSGYIFAPPGTAMDAPINPSISYPKIVRIYTVDGFVLTESNAKDDIAFIQVDKPFTTKGFIRVATADEIAAIADKSDINGYGFGDVYETGALYSNYARSYPLKWNGTSSSTNTFEITSPNATACSGDSGGPITAKLASGEEVLIAVMSGAAGVVNHCGTATNGIYTMRVTKVHPYMDLVAAALAVPTPTPSVKPVVKKYKITCVKGKVKKFVTGTAPKCPTGYKQTAKVTIS